MVFFFFSDRPGQLQKKAAQNSAVRDLETQTVILVTRSGRYPIKVELAENAAKRAKGLMFRRSLGDHEGMLFLYPAPQEISMWMKDTYIALDMIFVRRNGRVHRIERHTEPFSLEVIHSEGRVTSVLELKAGAAHSFNLEPGDRIEHPFFKLPYPTDPQD